MTWTPLSISTLRGIHRGRTAYIFGTGRSLAQLTDLELETAASGVTFATNYLIRWDRFARLGRELVCGCRELDWIRFNPTYWCVAELAALKDIANLIQGVTTNRVLAHPIWSDLGDWIEKHRDEHIPLSLSASLWYWVRRKPYWDADPKVCTRMNLGDFYQVGSDGHCCFASGGSVVLDCALQLAVWTGCTDIVFLGVDIDDRGHVYADDAKPMYPRHRGAVLASVPVLREQLERCGVKLWRGSDEGNLDLPVKKLD